MVKHKATIAFWLGLVLAGAVVTASPIKNWTTSEYVTYTDLNNNFNHLHANLGHGHGPIITADDISSSAKIRPEQTTFGASINKSMVFVGTFRTNPDGGSAYTSINSTGSLVVNVTKSVNGYTVLAASAYGINSDGGTSIYTIFNKSVGYGSAGNSLCYDTLASTTLISPLSLSVDCINVASLPTGPITYLSPSGVAIEVYSNKVQ